MSGTLVKNRMNTVTAQEKNNMLLSVSALTDCD